MKSKTMMFSPKRLRISGRLRTSLKWLPISARTRERTSSKGWSGVTLARRVPSGPAEEMPRFEVKTISASEK